LQITHTPQIESKLEIYGNTCLQSRIIVFRGFILASGAPVASARLYMLAAATSSRGAKILFVSNIDYLEVKQSSTRPDRSIGLADSATTDDPSKNSSEV